MQGGCGKTQRWGRYFRFKFLKGNLLVLPIRGAEVILLNLAVRLDEMKLTQLEKPNVRFWPIADMSRCIAHVRFQW